MKSKHHIGGESFEQGDSARKKSQKKSELNSYSSADGDDRRKDRPGDSSDEEDLTAAERRSKKFKRRREKEDLEAVAKLSHRERVDKFNEDLGKLTEHDLPTSI